MTRKMRFVSDLIVNVSAYVEGELKDWPKMLQDKVYKEIEKRSLVTGHKYVVVRSKCDMDGAQPFIHVVMYREVTIQ